jgi:hypothetical protein
MTAEQLSCWADSVSGAALPRAPLRTLCVDDAAGGHTEPDAGGEFGSALAGRPGRFCPVVQLDRGAWLASALACDAPAAGDGPRPGDVPTTRTVVPGRAFDLVVWSGVALEDTCAGRLRLLRRALAAPGLLVLTPGVPAAGAEALVRAPERWAALVVGAGLRVHSVVGTADDRRALVLAHRS